MTGDLQTLSGSSVTLRVSFEVSLENRFVVARLRECGRGLASWERVGEVGGAWVGGRWSLSCPPWKVLRMVDPLVSRERSEDVEPEAPAPEMLWVDGEAGGNRCDKELFSFPFCSKVCLSVLVRSVHT